MSGLHAPRGLPAARRIARNYRRLVRLVDRIISEPETVLAQPPNRFSPRSVERRLIVGVRALLARAEADREDRRRSEERFNLAVEGASAGIWEWNLDTDEVYFSPRWKEILGYRDDEVANDFEEWRRRIHPADYERAVAALDAFRRGEAPFYQIEVRLRHRDGSYRWTTNRGAALRDADGRVSRIAGSHTDITDHRLAEEALREREAQYRSIFEATSDGIVINDLETGLVLDVNPAFCRLHGYTREELLGAHPALYVEPDSRPIFDEFYSAIRDGRTPRTQATGRRKDGSAIFVEVQGSAITYAGRPCVLGVVRDISERMLAWQQLEQRVAERTRELTTLLDVSNTVASTLDLQPLLGLILDQLQVVAAYTGSSLLALDGDSLVVLEARGASARGEGVIGLRFPLSPGTPIVTEMIRRRPIIVADVHEDSPLAEAYRGAVAGLADSPSFNYARSWLAVPMVLNDEFTGILSLSHEQPGFYTAEHARLASAIATQAAIAIENARLYQRAQQVAAVEERQRLARELHDSVSQSLFSMAMISGALPRLLSRDAAQAVERSERLHELALGALAEMRALIFELHPESLEREGLTGALERLAAAMQARHGIETSATLDGGIEAPIEVQEALYRIAQEALHNTVKHAHAARIAVRLTAEPAALLLEIEDDGTGFDPGGPFPGHLGHRTMRERAERMGGTLAILSSPGSGTTVRARIPLPSPAVSGALAQAEPHPGAVQPRR